MGFDLYESQFNPDYSEKEFRCLQCNAILDEDKGFCNNICFEANCL